MSPDFEIIDVPHSREPSPSSSKVLKPWNGRDLVQKEQNRTKKFTFENAVFSNDYLVNKPPLPKKQVEVNQENKEAEVDHITKAILPVLKIEEEGIIDPVKDIVEMAEQGLEITENLKKDANGITILDLGYTRLLNPPLLTILSCFRNLEQLIMPETLKSAYDDTSVSEKKQLQLFGARSTQDFSQDFNKIIESIANLENLTHLDMSKWITSINRCELFTDQYILILFRSRKLQYLNMNGCHDVVYGWARHIHNCRELKHLSLSSSMIVNDNNLEYIAKLSLTHLELSDNLSISDRGLMHVGKILTLEYLELRGLSRITNQGVEYISNCHMLKHLDLAGCRHVYKSLSHIAKLLYLEYLDLSNIDINNITIKLLYPLTNLKTLKLLNTNVDQKAIDFLKRELPNLNVIT